MAPIGDERLAEHVTLVAGPSMESGDRRRRPWTNAAATWKIAPDRSPLGSPAEAVDWPPLPEISPHPRARSAHRLIDGGINVRKTGCLISRPGDTDFFSIFLGQYWITRLDVE